MDYLPLFARISDMPCLIVGGGSVGTRKAQHLLRGGAIVTVCAPDFSPELLALAKAGDLQLHPGEFTDALLTGCKFVIAATGEKSVNQQVAAAADARDLFCNVVDDRELSTAILPAIIDRSPLMVAISSGGTSPVLATRVRQQIETLLAPRMGEVAALMGEWRDQVKKRFATFDDRRHFWQRWLDSPAAELSLNGDQRRAASLTADMLKDTPARNGLASIVGAGPGDPELLTLKAIRALNTADVVVHDRLVARAVLDYARKDAECISVGKQAGKPSISQEAINELLVKLVRDGKRVCRIKGGDPFIFGRGGEEVDALEAAGLPWVVVPGITAAVGCAAAAGVPLTHREVARSLTLTTAHTNDDSDIDWASLANGQQTAVFYMGVSKVATICSALINAGRAESTPALLIENGTTDKQRLIRGTLSDLPSMARAKQVKSPALLVVGDVAAMGRRAEQLSLAASHNWSGAAPTDQSKAADASGISPQVDARNHD